MTIGDFGKSRLKNIYTFLAVRSYSAIVFAALFCTLAVKLFHSLRIGLVYDYSRWIYSDIAFLLAAEIVLSYCCYRWNKKRIIRTAIVIASVICTWSVMNAGWIIRTGTQILPQVLLPLIREPITSLTIIGINLAKMPAAAFALLGPSAIALVFVFYTVARPKKQLYNKEKFKTKIIITSAVILTALILKFFALQKPDTQTASMGLKFNSQVKAASTLLNAAIDSKRKSNNNPASLKILPKAQDTQLERQSAAPDYNIIIVILEGIQYRLTSLADNDNNNTPYLRTIAEQGVEFANTRTSLTHTTKALFALHTGQNPSVLQDIAEAVPSQNNFAGLVSILKKQAGYRAAFFQSAKGNFESRPALVSNLGFDQFYAREDLNDPNAFVGYLGCDEFALLKPLTNWITQNHQPFIISIMCSITHDPYQAPLWYGIPPKQPFDRYIQSIQYTDTFLAALDDQLEKMNLKEKTILCVIGDHAEAFGEHGFLGHERIVFEEALRIPWVMRAPGLIDANTKISHPAASIDLSPTLLKILGFQFTHDTFDGLDALGPVEENRKIYFSGWMNNGPAGYMVNNKKYIYDPINDTLLIYDLKADPLETISLAPTDIEREKIIDDINKWRQGTIFKIDQQQEGEKILFDRWQCIWDNRISSTKRISQD